LFLYHSLLLRLMTLSAIIGRRAISWEAPTIAHHL
jgi:hypothetical protein